MSVLLDTHIWVWWLTAGSPLTDTERDALDDEASRGELRLSAISLWEARLIVATARAHAFSLVTHDATIRRSRSVRLWRPKVARPKA